MYNNHIGDNMSVEGSTEKQLTPEEIQAQKFDEFLKIRNYKDEVIYKTTSEELEDCMVSIISTGSFTKTFTLYGGKIELVYQSLTESERAVGYEAVRVFMDNNKDKFSNVQLESYNAKVNIALQLIRVVTNGTSTSFKNGVIDDRIKLLSETPEDMLQLYSKYLGIFANITAKAFQSEDVLKNF